MKLMGVREYLELRYTPKSRPCPRFIQKLIRNGEIPGVKRGSLYFVDIEAEERMIGNSLVDNVLQNRQWNMHG